MERYRLDRRPFALGAASALYDCTDAITGERLAAKVFDCRTESGRRRAQRMFDGVALLEGVTPHPGIIEVRAALRANDRAILVTERFSSGTLLSHIMRRGRLRESDAAPISAQLLCALAHLHRSGVMHRDVKPENLLLRKDSAENKLRIVLADFGLAAPAARTAEIVGSPPYTAPEIARIALVHDTCRKETTETYDERCDVWSAGVVTYAMLSGRLPFDGAGPHDVFDAVCRANAPPFPADAWRGVSDCARNFVLHLMTRAAENRPTAEKALTHPWLNQLRP